MDVKAFYNSIGGDYATAISRLMRDSLAEKFILKFVNDPSFAQLAEAVKREDWDAAFGAAHTLKGVSMNLAFAKLSDVTITLTDALRPQNADSRNAKSLKAMFEAVETEYNKVISEIRKG